MKPCYIYTNTIGIFQCTIDVCLFVVLRPTREFFTHMETKPLSMKGLKI